MLKRIFNKSGDYQDIQHFDLDAWIAEGWLTSPPELVEKPLAVTDPKSKN